MNNNKPQDTLQEQLNNPKQVKAQVLEPNTTTEPVNSSQGIIKQPEAVAVKPRKAIRLKPKQRATLDYWLNPKSVTFGNLYKSALQAGFSNSYAINLTSLNPDWLSRSIDKVELAEEHITQGIQALAISSNNSRSPDDTRLKALELLAKLNRMLDGNTTTVNIVQPILGGASVKSDIIDV